MSLPPSTGVDYMLLSILTVDLMSPRQIGQACVFRTTSSAQPRHSTRWPQGTSSTSLSCSMHTTHSWSSSSSSGCVAAMPDANCAAALRCISATARAPGLGWVDAAHTSWSAGGVMCVGGGVLK